MKLRVGHKRSRGEATATLAGEAASGQAGKGSVGAAWGAPEQQPGARGHRQARGGFLVPSALGGFPTDVLRAGRGTSWGGECVGPAGFLDQRTVPSPRAPLLWKQPQATQCGWGGQEPRSPRPWPRTSPLPQRRTGSDPPRAQTRTRVPSRLAQRFPSRCISSGGGSWGRSHSGEKGPVDLAPGQERLVAAKTAGALLCRIDSSASGSQQGTDSTALRCAGRTPPGTPRPVLATATQRGCCST
ncbi:uncharacterized protein LOC103049592 [Python bivittatus]|uniref:Uncharacterized protein LOC103049592 n=1 Tax=Python bivittatus TaxID=176946 RepID=A0A9F2R3W0_PYTBI|nr:uncharacterized protein LOC103049592 [Python bivittatus]